MLTDSAEERGIPDLNYATIFYILGWVLGIEGVLMLPSCLTALVYREGAGLAFLPVIALCLAAGLLLTRKRPRQQEFYAREGFVIVAISWIAMSIMGCLPFLISGAIPSPVDAFFETVSGFTTTGASILSDVESLPRCLLFWRSFTHWIGGMGVLVFLLLILPMAGGYRINLMRAESPGPSVDKLAPKVQSTAKWLYGIYAALTLMEIVLLLFGGLPLFDALTLSFGTAGTGGFGILNDSIASYSSYIQIVITVFMILFGINFNLYFLCLMRHFKRAIRSEELRWYLGLIAASIVIITVNICRLYSSVAEALRLAAFQVASIITTTGYCTADFGQWPSLSRAILLVLMFIGASAGSTGGGIKVSRVILLAKSIRQELHRLLRPRRATHVTLSGKVISPEIVHSVNVYLVAYLLIIGLSALALSLDRLDGVTTFTAIISALNNIGPGLGRVGPVGNFSIFSPLSKLVLCFDMLAGRLEIFPILLLFFPETWRRF